MVLEYTTDLEAASSLELFDIHLMDSFEKTIKKEMKANKEENQDDETQLPEDSHTSTYFMENIFSILSIPEEEIFTKSMDYNHQFIRKLADDNLQLNEKLERFKSEYIKGLSSRANFIASVIQFTTWVCFH